jgi:polar amino acid transport system permease protein
MIPPMLSQTLMQLKNTSLISTMAVGELLYQGTVITAATYRPLEVYTIIAVIYFAVLFPLTMVTQRLETRLAVSD